MDNEPQPTDESGQPTNGGGESPPPGRFRSYRQLFTHWAIFLGILGATVAVNQWQITWVNIHFASWTAEMMGWIMRMMGAGGAVHGIHVSTTVCKFKIIGECTAYYPLSIYLAAVLAFPVPWLRRVVGVVVGIPILMVINQGRLISLCYLLQVFPDEFEMIHLVVWQSLIIFFTVFVWVLWVTLYARRP